MEKEQIKKCFNAVVYHYCGPRWSDVGLQAKFKAALNNMNISSITLSTDEKSCGAAYRNCANSAIKSKIYADIQHGNTVKQAVFLLEWEQFGGAFIKEENAEETYIKADDNSIEISDGFVELINWLLSE